MSDVELLAIFGLFASVVALGAIALLRSMVRGATSKPQSRIERRAATPAKRAAPATPGVAQAEAPGLRFEIRMAGMPAADPRTRADILRAGEAAWVPPGQESKLGRYTIPGGMIYLGSDVPGMDGWSDEPALIDPKLDVASSGDGAGELGYWPSYSRITPAARARFLQWLADGRQAPDIDAGYVFILFYGLERRALFDAEHSEKARADLPAILSELERLLSIYGHHHSFRGYATRLVQALRLKVGDGDFTGHQPALEIGYELPLDVRLAIGQLSVAGRPIPADLALAWYLGHPTTGVRTPVRRCFEEFSELFRVRYRNMFGDGMVVKPNKRKLSVSYRPATSTMRGDIEIPVGDLPDLATLSGPINKLTTIAETCTSDLAAYSRLIGKNPEARGTLPAAALLPAELATRRHSEEMTELGQWLSAALGDSAAVSVAAETFFDHWPTAKPDKMAKKEALGFAQVLDRLGYGVEPDVRFGGKPWKREDRAVLFPLPEEHSATATASYTAATFVLHLASLVAAADGEVSEEEAQRLEEHLEVALHLEPAEVVRLRAHIRYLLEVQPGIAGLKKRVEGLDEERRSRFAEFAVSVAAADGVIDPGEVKVLEKIYKLLGMDPGSIFTTIHTMQAGGTPPPPGPVTVRKAEPGEKSYSIPPEPKAAPGSVADPGAPIQLDMNRVRTKLAETAAVSSLLANIFTEDEPEAGPTQEPAATAQPSPDALAVAGLDEANAGLLEALRQKERWARAEFEALAEQRDLLADAAYETLNEAAFEAADEPLLEGDDPIDINQSALSAMLP